MKQNKRILHYVLSLKPALSGKIGYLLVALMLFTAVLAGCAGGAAAVDQSTQTGEQRSTTDTAIVAPLYDEGTVVSLYERNIPAVVQIETVIQASTSNFGPFNFNVPNRGGQGSGFFIDNEGHILTNNHVVENASKVTVILHDGTRLEADVTGTDAQNDLALITVDTGKLNEKAFLTLGDSDTIRPGQMAIAMGSPFGLEGSITVGIVSGVERSLPSEANRTIVDVIQTDAAINPGNSGGPLLNSSGEVIGINTAMEASSTGIGFAIPANTAESRLPALLRGGEIKNPWLGISGMTIDPELASRLDLPVESGIYIVSVFSNSPAEKAGLLQSGSNEQGQPASGGDIITAVDNKPMTAIADLLSYLNGKLPGDKVSLSLYRGNEKVTVSITLDEWPEQAP
jgi:S1-C subfamily serine protease